MGHHHWAGYMVSNGNGELQPGYQVVIKQSETPEQGRAFHIQYSLSGCQDDTPAIPLPHHLTRVSTPEHYHRGIIDVLGRRPGHRIQLLINILPSGAIRIYNEGNRGPLLVLEPMQVAELGLQSSGANAGHNTLLSVLINPFFTINLTLNEPLLFNKLIVPDSGSESDDEVKTYTLVTNSVQKMEWVYYWKGKSRSLSMILDQSLDHHYHIQRIKGIGLELSKMKQVLCCPVKRRGPDSPEDDSPPDGSAGGGFVSPVLLYNTYEKSFLDMPDKKNLIDCLLNIGRNDVL